MKKPVSTINIGSIQMPITAATKSFALLAKRGAGKTYAAGVMAEEFAKAGIPFVVFDPIDVWWGLRLAANGRGKGLPVVVFGIEHADIKIDRTMGRKIAEAVVKHNISAVISTFGMSKVDQRYLIAEFAETLLNINNTPRHVFVEEAHEYVPQRVQPGMGVVFSRVESLVTMGRNRGIGVTLLNQRAATINKDVLTQVDTLIALRSIGPQDRKALEDWVAAHGIDGMDETKKELDEFVSSLPSLPTGEAWVWSPEFLEVFKRVRIRKRETFHPDREKIGVNFKVPKISSTDIESFVSSFNEKKPEQKKQTLPVGTKIILSAVDMKAEINKALAKQAAEFDLERAGWQRQIENWFTILKDIGEASAKAIKDYKKPGRIHMPSYRPITPSKVTHNEASTERRPITASEAQEGISGPEQRILDAIAWLDSIGNPEPEQVAVAFLAGYTYGGGGFNKPRGSLKVKGLIEYVGDRIKLTPEGYSSARVPDGHLDRATLHAKILKTLPGPEQKLLQPLLDNNGEEMSKDELAELSGYKAGSGGFNKPCGRLRSLGLIEYPSSGRVKARSILFI